MASGIKDTDSCYREQLHWVKLFDGAVASARDAFTHRRLGHAADQSLKKLIEGNQ